MLSTVLQNSDNRKATKRAQQLSERYTGAGTVFLNTTGIRPTEFKCLIAPKPVEDKVGSIIIPDATKESEKYAQIEGQIVAMSHLAFTYATADEWGEHKPKPGDRVLYAKYAGVRVKGKDGKEYVLVNDKDICAVVENDMKATASYRAEF